MAPLVGVFTIVIILTNIQARHHYSSSQLLSRLLNPRSSDTQSQIIVIIDTRDQLSLGDQSETSDESGERDDEPPGYDEAYQLYNQLKFQPDDDLSSSERETKQVLRAALISRCRKVDKCAKKCPKQKKFKFTCIVTCQETYDKDNLCDEPAEEIGKKQKWGRTMPPKWLIF